MSYEDVRCPICGKIGDNIIEEFTVTGHPNVTEFWLVCKCGHDIKEVSR